MDPPSPWPPPAKYDGRTVMRMRTFTAQKAEDGRIIGVPSPDGGLGVFRIVDATAPYVVMKGAEPGAPGPWLDLEPDYLAKDEEGYLVFIRGHGDIRERLARLGITRERWESLNPHRRKQVIIAIRSVMFAESAISMVAKHGYTGVTESAQRYLLKLVKLMAAEVRAPRGFRSEQRKSREFHRAKRLLDALVPLLSAVKVEGSRLHRNTFTDSAWCGERAAWVNSETGARGLGRVCSAEDVAGLAAAEPKDVASALASKATGIPEDSLRYEKLRFRSKKRNVKPRKKP